MKVQGIHSHPRRASHSFAAIGMLLVCLSAARCGSSGSNTPATDPPSGNGNNTTTNNSNNTTNANTTDSNGTTASSRVTLQIKVTSFGFDTAAGTLNANLLQFSFNDPTLAFAGAGAPFGATAVTDTDCAVTAGALDCNIMVPNFDVGSYTHGLLVLTGDNRPSASTPLWRQIYALVPQASIDAAKASTGKVLVVQAGAITDTGEAAIATWSGQSSTATYLSPGALLGVVTTSTGTAVGGATLHTGAHAYTTYYANDTATAVGTTSTGAKGLFLAVNTAGTAAANTDWTITPQSPGLTWTLPYTGTVPHALTLMYFEAN